MIKNKNTFNRNLKNLDLESLFRSLDVEGLSKPFDLYIEAIESFYTSYNISSSSYIFRAYKSFDVDVNDEKEVGFITSALRYANYNINSLKGENVILFSEPVIVSEIDCKNLMVNGNENAIRLITFLGSDKRFSINNYVYYVNSHGEKESIAEVTKYKVHDVVLGVVLPKNCNPLSMKIVKYSELHTDQNKLLQTKAALQAAKDIPGVEIQKIKNKLVEINNVIYSKADELISVEGDIDVAEQNKLHAESSLESSKEVLEKVRVDLDKSSEAYETLKMEIIKKLNKLNLLLILLL